MKDPNSKDFGCYELLRGRICGKQSVALGFFVVSLVVGEGVALWGLELDKQGKDSVLATSLMCFLL